jgi:hypothetical protein
LKVATPPRFRLTLIDSEDNVPVRPSSLAFAIALLVGAGAGAGGPAWTDLTKNGLGDWSQPHGRWYVAGSVSVDPKNPRRLIGTSGEGILINGPAGRTENLLSKKKYGDIEAHVEFLIPKGSNSGVKFEGLYEIQIFDSYGVKKPKASDCGGIYPRAEMLPVYHHIDDGIPPQANAARRPGEWQTLDVIFQTPRFDEQGKKTANARFVKVVLNDQLIHENVDVKTPTGHVWRDKEFAAGPLLLQADHGPVAFRNIRVRPYH